MTPPRRVPLKEPLTRMEAVVVDLVGPGYTYDQVALALGLATRTVRMHCERAAKKMPGTVPCLTRIVLWWQGYSVEALYAYAHGRRVQLAPEEEPQDAECRRQPAATVAPLTDRPSRRGAVR